MTAARQEDVTTRRAGPSDAALLAALGARAFADTFAADNSPEDLAAYLAGAFGEAIQRAELEDPGCTVFLAERGDEVVGFLTLREGPTPACVPWSDVIEIARLYAVHSAIGSGVGATLMRRAIAEALMRGREGIWLGVWERNARAIAFYQRFDFHQAGSQPFMLGRDRQIDLVMVRRTAREG